MIQCNEAVIIVKRYYGRMEAGVTSSTYLLSLFIIKVGSNCYSQRKRSVIASFQRLTEG